MTKNLDVQLYAVAVHLTADDVPGVGQLHVTLTHDQFDDFAETVREAALNKKGRTSITCQAQGIQPGDVICGMEVEDTYTYEAGVGSLTQLIFKPGGVMQVTSEFMVKAERPIA